MTICIFSDSLHELDQQEQGSAHPVIGGALTGIRKLRAHGFKLLLKSFPLKRLLQWLPDKFDHSHKSAYSHLTDVLRYFVLYSAGGVYMDFDVVCTNTWVNLPESFFHFQYSATDPPPKGSNSARIFKFNDPMTWQLNTAFSGFRKGHPFLLHLLQAVEKSHNPDDWASVGNEMVHRVINELRKSAKKTRVLLGDVQIIPMSTAAPVSWHRAAKCAVANDPFCEPRCAQNLESGWVFHMYNKGTKVSDEGVLSAFEKGSCFHRPMTQFRLDING